MKRSFLKLFIPVLVCALLCAGIPTLLILTGREEPVRAALNTLLTPIRTLTADVGDHIRSLSAYFTEFDALKEENERLRTQLASMEDKIRQAEQALEENAFLSDFLSLKENNDDYRFLKCEIVSSDSSGYLRTLTLNAGTRDGAAVGYPVITAAGVIGRITEVGVNWSHVEPITEISSSVGAYVERSGAEGVAEGSYLYRGEGKLVLSYLSDDADIAIGDRIRTSGVNSFYPRGLLIGEVTAIQTDPLSGARTAVITPTAVLSEQRSVMILTDFAVYKTDGSGAPR